MVIFGGDLYDDQVFKTDEVSQILKSIQCQYGKLAILGERDEKSSLEVTQVLNNGGLKYSIMKHVHYITKIHHLHLSPMTMNTTSQNSKKHKINWLWHFTST